MTTRTVARRHAFRFRDHRGPHRTATLHLRGPSAHPEDLADARPDDPGADVDDLIDTGATGGTRREAPHDVVFATGPAPALAAIPRPTDRSELMVDDRTDLGRSVVRDVKSMNVFQEVTELPVERLV